jgi:hypothetical protein
MPALINMTPLLAYHGTSWNITFTTYMEEKMKVRTNNNGMKQLKKLGFKKVPGTEPGFHMYELNPAELGARQRIHDNLKAEAASNKPQAASIKRQALDKSK